MLGIALATALLSGACGSDMEPAESIQPDSGPLQDEAGQVLLRWVGAVEETDVRVAMLAGAGRARLFFCGGAESYATATRWFNIEFDGGESLPRGARSGCGCPAAARLRPCCCRLRRSSRCELDYLPLSRAVSRS